MAIVVNWQVILGIFLLELVAYRLLVKAKFQLKDVPDAICDSFAKFRAFLKRSTEK